MQQQVSSRPAPLPAPVTYATWASLPTPVQMVVADNWSFLSNSASEIDAIVSARHSADIAVAEQVATTVEELALRRKARAGSAKRQRGVTSAATRPAPTATSTGAGTSSAQQDASTSSSAPSATLAARLGPPQQPRLDQVSVTGCHRRSGDHAFLQGGVVFMARQPRSIFAKEEATAVVDSARALMDEVPEERLLSVDEAWRLLRNESWEARMRVEIIMGLVTSLRIAHDHYASDVFWPTPQKDELDQERRALAAGRDRNGGGPGRDRNGGGAHDRRGSGGGSGNGGSSRGSSGGGSSGGGSNKDGGSDARTGGGRGGYGGGGHARRSGATGKGSRGKGGHSHSSSGDRRRTGCRRRRRRLWRG